MNKGTSEILTITTIKGLFRVKRLSFGVSVAPLIFQQSMDCMFSDLERVITYLDDILITGLTEAQHDERVAEVLERLHKASLQAKKQKCMFRVSEVEFLGFHVDAKSPTQGKLLASTAAPEPTNRT